MWQRLFKKKPISERQFYVPADTVVYAVGDIHGRLDLLKKLQRMIVEDSLKREESQKVIVYLGDYVDRGHQSYGVLECMITTPLDIGPSFYLMGNHEWAMLSFLRGDGGSEAWLNWGGDTTMQSYGVALRTETGEKMPIDQMREQFRGVFPDTHRQFCEALQMTHQIGDYLFVHAGLNPEVSLEEQTPMDMLTIREAFYQHRKPLPMAVVFGHTVFNEPFHMDDRIGIDTGAYATGKLTSLVLSTNTLAFLHT